MGWRGWFGALLRAVCFKGVLWSDVVLRHQVSRSSDTDSQERPMVAIAFRRLGIAPMGRSCSLGSARDTAPDGSTAHCRASLRGDPGMLESVQPNPTSFCPIDSPIDGRIGGTPGQPGPDADTISTSLREASFVSRP